MVGILWAGGADVEEISFREVFHKIPYSAINWFLAKMGVEVPKPMDSRCWPIGGITRSRFVRGPRNRGAKEFFVTWRHPRRQTTYDQWLSPKDIRSHGPAASALLAEFVRTKEAVSLPAAEGKLTRVSSILFDGRNALSQMKVVQGAAPSLSAGTLVQELTGLGQVKFLMEWEDRPASVVGLAEVYNNWPMFALCYFCEQVFGVLFDPKAPAV
jgi:hypothetical protein